MIRKIYDHIEEIVLVPGFAIMLIINFANVLSRYVLGTSWAFTEELCVLMFVYVTFFGAAVAIKQRQHLGFVAILEKLPLPARIVVDTFIFVSVIIFLVVMIYFGIQVCLNQLKFNSVTASLRISTAWNGASIPLSGIFMILRTVENYVHDMKEHLGELRKERS